MTYRPLPTVANIQKKLESIFPDGIENRNYVTREIAAKTIFVMIYIGAIEEDDIFIRPSQITRMSDIQAALNTPDDREQYCHDSGKPGYTPTGTPWYQDNTRESIRDETLRQGLVYLNAAGERTDLPTTSSRGRYRLKHSFADLFLPTLQDQEFEKHAKKWRNQYLSTSSLARLHLLQQGVTGAQKDQIQVTFPNGEVRSMATGPSSIISKSVIEIFSNHFLETPGVIFLSESGNKVVQRDDALAKSIGLEIDAGKHLPDIIMVDLGSNPPLVVFVEVVHTDGPVNQQRKDALMNIVTNAGFKPEQVAFLTAFMDRSSNAYRKLSQSIAWETFVWFVSEPDKIIIMKSNEERANKLHELM